MKEQNKDKVVIITGASSGIGKETAKCFMQKGFKVYGLSRRTFEEQGIISLSCDVTDSEQVKNVVNDIFEKEGRIDVLINNAGFGISGSVENQDMESIKRLFDVNFFGVVNVTKQVLPILRNQGGGKIINTGSVAGVIPLPFQSFYSSTKASLDIFSKALKMEVRPYNISVCNVLVGDTKTGFTQVREKSLTDIGSVYEKTSMRSVAKMEKDEQHGKDPKSVSKVMLKLAKKKKMPATKIVGASYKFLLFLTKILPQRLMLFVVRKMYS